MRFIAQQDLSKLIGEIYDCALDPSLWPHALENITKVFDARMTTILAHDPMTRSVVFLHRWGDDSSQMTSYAEKFAAINPLLTAGWHSDIDEPVNLQRFMDPEEFQLTRFYKEFMAPVGWRDMVGATIQKWVHRYTAITSILGEEVGMTGDRELEVMGLLAPHIRRAVTIHETLQASGERVSNLSAALDIAPNAIFLLDDAGKCLETNQAAERFLSDEDGATVERGRLLFADAEVRAQIAVAVASSAKGECARLTSTVVRAHGRSFAVEMLPLTSGVRQAAHASGRAVLGLFLHEVGCLQPLPGEVLVKLYGLTPAETRLLVLLAQAMSLREAAEALGVREGTARTHLRQVLAKTGAKRQAEAVKLVMSALPRPPGQRRRQADRSGAGRRAAEA